VAQALRRVGGELQPDHLAAAAALQRRLELAHEVLGLLLDLEVAVAQHPERAHAERRVAGEEPVEEDLEQALQRQEADLALRPVRQADEALDLPGTGSSASSTSPSSSLRRLIAIAKPPFAMKGKGCAGSMASGVRTGKTCSRK
jgi:hypothetical protein